MDNRTVFKQAIEEYLNFGVITPKTEQLLLAGNADPDARAKLWQKVAKAIARLS